MVLNLIVYALAVARLTRLINADTVLDRPRLYIAGRVKAATELADNYPDSPAADDYRARERRWSTAFYFVQCPWCVGLWLTLATAWVPLWYADNLVARYAGVALAVSHLIGVCARFADTEDIDFEDETVN